MKHQTGKDFVFDEKMPKGVAAFSLTAEKLTAKASRYDNRLKVSQV